jgi:dUTP pyrophosphatase
MSEAMAPVVRFKRLRAGAVLPRYMTAGAAGMDLVAAAGEEVVLAPGGRGTVPTGWAVELPRGYEGQIRPRSGLALRSAVTVLNAPGTIDSDYRGELTVLLVNLGTEAHVVRSGDRIAQLVVAPVAQAAVEEVATLSDTARGEGGFGHTGTG